GPSPPAAGASIAALWEQHTRCLALLGVQFHFEEAQACQDCHGCEDREHWARWLMEHRGEGWDAPTRSTVCRRRGRATSPGHGRWGRRWSAREWLGWAGKGARGCGGRQVMGEVSAPCSLARRGRRPHGRSALRRIGVPWLRAGPKGIRGRRGL